MLLSLSEIWSLQRTNCTFQFSSLVFKKERKKESFEATCALLFGRKIITLRVLRNKKAPITPAVTGRREGGGARKKVMKNWQISKTFLKQNGSTLHRFSLCGKMASRKLLKKTDLQLHLEFARRKLTERTF